MKLELSEKFLKWLILESLPTFFDAMKLTYNALKEEWTMEELMFQMWMFLLSNSLPTNQGEHGDQIEPGVPVDGTVVDGIPLRRS